MADVFWSWALAALMALHGAVHLLGFVAATGLAEVPELSAAPPLLPDVTASDPVVRALGVLWLIACLGFATTAVGIVTARRWWPPLALASAVLSIGLVGLWWDQAWAGLVPNVVVLLVLAVSWGRLRGGRWPGRRPPAGP